jgi:uncharacterized protein (DUF697 family)
MCTKSKVLATAVALTVIGSALETLSASAATTACGAQCGSVFSRELGTYAQPGVVEDISQGEATVASL